MSDYLDAVRLLVRIAHTKSFTAAGRDAGLPQSTVSRMLKSLERRIGVSLVVRTTRGVSMTEAGAEFVNRMEPLLARMDEAEHEAREYMHVSGSLRVSVVSSLAVRWVVPCLRPFVGQHPRVRLELLIADHRQQLAAEGVDLALRIGEPIDQTPLMRRLLTWPRFVVASDDYLARCTVPEQPGQLRDHEIIAGPTGLAGGWSFSRNGRSQTVTLESRLVMGSSEAAVAAAVAGLGITRCPEGACMPELRDGRLVRLLPEWDAGTVELNALFGIGGAAKPAARALADYLAVALKTSQEPSLSAAPSMSTV